MFIAGGGFSILNDFIDPNLEENRDLSMLSVDAFYVVFEDQTNLQIPRADLVLGLTERGLHYKLIEVIAALLNQSIVAEGVEGTSTTTSMNYLEKAWEVLIQFAHGEERDSLCGEDQVGRLLDLALGSK